MLETAQRGKKAKKAAPAKAASKKTALHERYLEAFRWMLLARVLEEKLGALYRGGMIVGGVYLGKGQEAVSAACGMFLEKEKGDVFGPLIRDQAGRSAFGEPLLDVVRTYLGSVKGPMRGRDGNIHRGRPRENQLAMISHLGAMIPVMVGKLLAKRMKGEKDFVGLTTIGEGGMQTGATHEGLNIAAVEQVPLVVVVTNNHWAYSTPNEREFACANLVDRAIGYGYEGQTIDGTDLNACLEAVETAVKRARAGRPPQLVVAEVLRLAGHGEHDDASYVPQEMKGQPFAQDPVARTEKFILEQGLLDHDGLKQMRAEIAKEIDEAVATAQQEDGPQPREEDWRALSTPGLIDNPSA
ncbi:MAG TPA: thiamine pyrophosphate-dependent dehydrogenase E1 component subunit alpha [Chthoniobacterales bacterium]|jgi:pyruvate dehydrogenase E1 component alpha subunit/2-oxoisovalerate dehydrogenase E1 component alpha subunit|nr:thiamine pyrophosphate-dependent dehydrogenase E1 component subunit alpha [Chthoniobacterales bacterium]